MRINDIPATVFACVASADIKKGNNIILSTRADGTRIATPADKGLDGIALEDAKKDAIVRVVVSGIYA